LSLRDPDNCYAILRATHSIIIETLRQTDSLTNNHHQHPELNDLRQTRRAQNCSKTFNNRRASRKSYCFWCLVFEERKRNEGAQQCPL
jgi:hypothetical protein